jgi:hypothetical protein
MDVTLPGALFERPQASPSQALMDAFELDSLSAVKIAESMEPAEVRKVLVRAAAAGFFNTPSAAVTMGMVVSMALKTTELELLRELDLDAHADLARVLARQVRYSHRTQGDAKAASSRTRGELFDVLVEHVRPVDLLEVLAEDPLAPGTWPRRSFPGEPCLSADQAAVLVASLPEDLPLVPHLGAFLDAVTAASLIRFAGRRGAALAARAAFLDATTWPLLLSVLTPSEALSVASQFVRPSGKHLSAALPREVLTHLEDLESRGQLAPALASAELSSDVREAILKGVELTWRSTSVLVTPPLLKRWLGGSFKTKPEEGDVLAWARVHDARDVRLTEVWDPSVRTALATTLRGGAPHVRSLTESDEDLTELSAWLPSVAELFKGDERLYSRLLSATGSSPMADPSLSLSEARIKLWNRWNEAERRHAQPA